MMREALEGVDKGVKVAGTLLMDVRFADDQGIVVSSEISLQRLMDASGKPTAGKSYDMKMNVNKTKVMEISKTSGNISILIERQRVEQVNKFKYLPN